MSEIPDTPLTGNMPAERITPDSGLRQVARQASRNLEAVKALQDDYNVQLAASLAQRASLEQRLTAVSDAQTAATSAATSATAAAGAATTAANAAKTTADAAKAAADKAASDLAAFIARRDRTAPAVSVPAMLSLLNGAASVDVTLTWNSAWPDVNYDVVPVLDAPSTLMGKVTAAVKTKATTTVVLTITTTAVLAASTCTVRAVSVSST